MELCRKVIRLYQDIATSWVMDKDTWYVLVLHGEIIKFKYLVVPCYSHCEYENYGGVVILI